MIIKCPECGRQVSEKAPTCPTCGVQIAGKITRCGNCGEIYFLEDGICPSCHQSNVGTTYRPASAATAQQPGSSQATSSNKPSPKTSTTNAQGDTPNGNNKDENPAPKKKTGSATLIVAFIFAAIVCGCFFYFYNRAQSDKEREDYEIALRSSDSDVLQSYLLRYGDAPQEHRDSIEAKIQQLQKRDQDWQNAVLSNSRSALETYLKNNPDSPHRQEALNKIDSLDWTNAQKSNDLQTVQDYITEHVEGRYIDDAKLLASKLLATTVLPEEKQKIVSVFRQFFQSVNSKDESRLLSSVSMVLDSFLGKKDATSDDVITFLHRIYKEGITNMNWYIDQSSFKINKHEVAEEEFEYDVTFNVKKEVSRGSEKEEASYRVKAAVSTDGKISGFNLTKLN